MSVERTRRAVIVASLTGCSGLVAGAVLPVDLSGGAGPNDVDLGFCADMTAHHVQALVLCQRVLGRPTGDSVQAAAAEVLQNQAIEVGTMRAWLADWGASTTTPDAVMGWMHDGDDLPLSKMPGYASADDLHALPSAIGVAQGRLWLELMRAHHEGAVAMATVASTHAGQDKVRRLARAQVASQTYEIRQYDLLLATEYVISAA